MSAERLTAQRVVVDASSISAVASGARTRLVNLYRAYAAIEARPAITLFVSAQSDLAEAFAGTAVDVVEMPAEGRWHRLLSRGSRWSTRVADVGGQLLHVENVPVPSGCPVPVVLSLHDLRSFDSLRETITTSGLYARFILPRAVRHVAVVVTLSRYGSESVARRLGVPLERIRRVPAAADAPPPDEVLDREAAALRKRYGIIGPFVVCVGHLERRKNLRVVVEAVRRLNAKGGDEVGIVFVGKDKGEEQALRALAGGADPVRAWFLGQVPDAERWGSLRAASCVAVPSLVEGFGLVPLEAMEVGCPVVGSTASALPEVIGDGGLLVAPDDVSGLAEALAVAVRPGDARDGLIARGAQRARTFTWEAAAADLRDVHAELLGVPVR